MKINRCIFHQFANSSDLGGAEFIALDLAKMLCEKGGKVRFWVPGKGPTSQVASEEGLSTTSYPFSGMVSGRLAHALGCMRMMPRLNGAPDGVIHFHAPLVYRIVRPALLFSRCRSVVHVHIDTKLETLRWAFRQPPDLIVTCARYLVDQVRGQVGGPPENIRIRPILNAVDTDRFYPGDKIVAKRSVGAPLDRPLIVLAANLAAHKGHLTAVRAIGRLNKRQVNVECWFVGTEREGKKEYTEQIQKEITGCGVEEMVKLKGFTNDIPELMRAADIVILPSTQEGLPLVLLEAQASKTFTIAAPTSGVPEIIKDCETGYLAEADDDECYARRIYDAIENKEQTSRMVELAYSRIIGQHTMKTYRQKIWETYEELCAEGRQTPLR